MPQTVYWNPSAPADDVDFYEVWSSPDDVTFTLLVTIQNDTSGPNFDTNLTQFFYVDSVNPSTTWYKVRAHSGSTYSDFTIAMQGQPVALPTCRIYGRVVGYDGNPLFGTAVSAHIELASADMSGQFAGTVGVMSFDIEAITDARGNFEIDLIQGTTADLSIATINFEKSFTVPAQATANLTDLV